MSEPQPSWSLATQLVHAGRMRSAFGETSEALFLSSGFVYGRAEDAEARFADRDPGYMYSRVSNPTVRMFEQRMAMLEGAEEATATATGMAAVHAALLSLLKAGDRVVASRLLFGSCHYILTEILPRFGIAIELVDGRDLAAWERALSTSPPGSSSSRRRATPRSSWSTSRRSAPSPTRPAPSSSSTTSSPRRFCKSRCSSAPTSSSTRPPSTSTARAAASAALFCRRPS